MMRSLLLSLSLVSVAHAADRPEIGVPTRLTLGPGELGEQPEAVAASRLLLGAKLSLLIDSPDLSGAIGLGVRVHGSYVVHDRVWVAAGIEAFELSGLFGHITLPPLADPL